MCTAVNYFSSLMCRTQPDIQKYISDTCEIEELIRKSTTFPSVMQNILKSQRLNARGQQMKYET